MSWAAHDVEPYVMQRHLGSRVAFIPLLIGSYAPDLSTKWFVYGISFFGLEIKADNPAQFHRGWPGAGFTHSLAFGVVIGLLLVLVTRRPIWGWSFMLGQWAHALTDMGDTVGTMLLFPLTTHHFSVGAWAYAGQTGRFNDAGAYFSGLGFAWDGVWILLATMSWPVLTRSYFEETVLPADPIWSWAQGTLPMVAVLALYRASYFYGVTRWVAWLIWAHVANSYQFDMTWGGPHWVPALTASLPPVRAGPGRAAFLCPCGTCC